MGARRGGEGGMERRPEVKRWGQGCSEGIFGLIYAFRKMNVGPTDNFTLLLWNFDNKLCFSLFFISYYSNYHIWEISGGGRISSVVNFNFRACKIE